MIMKSSRADMQAQEQEAHHKQEAAVAARTAAIQALANMAADPLDLWQAAVQLAKSYTSAAGGAVCTYPSQAAHVYLLWPLNSKCVTVMA
jgi:hypothetical protein